MTAAIYAIRLSRGVSYFVGSVERPPLPYPVLDHAEFEFRRLSSPRLKALAERFQVEGGFIVHGTAAVCRSGGCPAQFYDCTVSEFAALCRGPCPECGKRTIEPFYLAWKGALKP